MKKSRFLVLLMVGALALSFCGCGAKEKDPEPEIVGGWTENEKQPTEAEAEYFAKAVEGTEYADYTLEALVGTQVVAGTNYKFRCTAPDGSEKIVTVYHDLQGNNSVTGVE